MANDENAAVVPALIKATEDPDPGVRRTAVTILGSIMNKKVRGGAHLRDQPTPFPLGTFAEAARKITAALERSLSDADTGVLIAAADALADIGPYDKAQDAAIIAGLERALHNKSQQVCDRIVRALCNFGVPPETVIELERTNRAPESQATPRN